MVKYIWSVKSALPVNVQELIETFSASQSRICVIGKHDVVEIYQPESISPCKVITVRRQMGKLEYASILLKYSSNLHGGTAAQSSKSPRLVIQILVDPDYVF